MKQMKIKIAIVLIFSIVISGIHVGMKKVNAENSMIVYGESVTATAGKEIKIPILMKANPGIAGLALKVSYNADVMTPVKAEKGAVLSGMSNIVFDDSISSHTGNVFECVAYNHENFSKNGELFVLTFQMADSVSTGTYNLDLEMTECYSSTADGGFEDIVSFCEKISVLVADEGTTPGSTVVGPVYVWEGEMTGWGGPGSYPSSATHAQGSGEGNFYYSDLTNIKNSTGYGCGLEFMNPYNPYFTGDANEMAQFFTKMKNPRIKVTLKNGGVASSWNWDVELSFSSGQEVVLPDGYLDNGYFVLFGNDDMITKVEFYDVTQDIGQNINSPNPSEPQDTGQNVNSPIPSESQDTSQNVNSPNPLETPGAGSANLSGTESPKSTAMPSVAEEKKDTGDTYVEVTKPGKVTRVMAKAEKKRVVVYWLWSSDVSGFQIQCARNRGFTKNKKTKNAGEYCDRITFKGLQRKKIYFVRVRAYREASGKKLYGNWSKVKKVRVK